MELNFFDFCSRFLRTLFDFSTSFLNVWNSTIPELVAHSSIGDVAVIGDVLSWIANISILENVTIAGLCFGSIAIVVIITLVKWFVSLIP